MYIYIYIHTYVPDISMSDRLIDPPNRKGGVMMSSSEWITSVAMT
jgi:hypothetical protein